MPKVTQPDRGRAGTGTQSPYAFCHTAVRTFLSHHRGGPRGVTRTQEANYTRGLDGLWWALPGVQHPNPHIWPHNCSKHGWAGDCSAIVCAKTGISD